MFHTGTWMLSICERFNTWHEQKSIKFVFYFSLYHGLVVLTVKATRHGPLSWTHLDQQFIRPNWTFPFQEAHERVAQGILPPILVFSYCPFTLGSVYRHWSKKRSHQNLWYILNGDTSKELSVASSTQNDTGCMAYLRKRSMQKCIGVFMTILHQISAFSLEMR